MDAPVTACELLAVRTPCAILRDGRGMPRSGDACALPLFVNSPASRTPPPSSRATSPDTPRPGHLRRPGARHRRAACTDFGAASTPRAVTRAHARRVCTLRGCGGRGRPRRWVRRASRRRGPRRRSAGLAGAGARRRVAGALPERSEHSSFAGCGRAGPFCGRVRHGERSHPDDRASVTCAGAHDPKPQCRVGRLRECPACAGRGDTSSTDDPIRKRHQDL